MNTAVATSSHTDTSAPRFNSTQLKALELLSSGFDAAQVANAIGISDSRISQMMHEEVFTRELAERRFKELRKHNETDAAADSLEKELLAQLKRCIPLLMKPLEIARVYQIINSAKRRGSSSPDAIHSQKRTITLNIPIAVVNKFQVNAANQVVEAGIVGESSSSMVTIQSGNMQRLLNEHSPNQNGSAIPIATAYGGDNEQFVSVHEARVAKRDARLELRESDGHIYRKPQGREKVDLLAECGFTAEIEITSETPSSSDSSSST